MDEQPKYGSHWVKHDIIPLGGLWAIVVGIIEDETSGDLKIRIAKGKVKGKVSRSLGEIKIEPTDPNDPIAQINRLNLKSRAEWERVKISCEKYFAMLEKGEVKHK